MLVPQKHCHEQPAKAIPCRLKGEALTLYSLSEADEGEDGHVVAHADDEDEPQR